MSEAILCVRGERVEMDDSRMVSKCNEESNNVDSVHCNDLINGSISSEEKYAFHRHAVLA